MSTDDRHVLRAISTFWNRHGYAPSLRDIRDELGLTNHSTVNHHVLSLRSRGLLTLEPSKNRTMRLTPEGIKHLEGTFPMERFDVAMLRRDHLQVAHLVQAHVECSGLLQAVVES